jgi:Arf-GAP/SH3 domain/ANK repeat/PH domain-containing protein
MDPIDLRVASVREARNADRRFCFEIITPNFTRVYQATSEEDMKSWIFTINNALQSAVEGKGAQGPVSMDSPSSSIRKDFASALTGKSHSQRSGSGHGGNKTVGRHATVGDRPSHRAPAESNESSQKLLQQIRDADESNRYCADCGSESKVDWVSINLGVVICIECSGIHRSLGTHVTKVRSLTLDPNAFTQDVIEIFFTVGNRVSNGIWEARLDIQKPNPQSSREQRLRFITSKYADRAYVQPLSANSSHFGTPDETLLASIKKNDIEAVAYALALQANPNVVDKSRGTHAVFLALAAADPASPSAGVSPTPGGSQSHSNAASSRKSFPVAELLLLNGANIPNSPPPIPLSLSGRVYLETKTSQLNGRRMTTASGNAATATALPGPHGSPNPDSGPSSSFIPSSSSRAIDEYHPGVGTGGDMLTALPMIGQAGPEQPRRKRISSGGRLIKQLPGDRTGASSGGASPRDANGPFSSHGSNNNNNSGL